MPICGVKQHYELSQLLKCNKQIIYIRIKFWQLKNFKSLKYQRAIMLIEWLQVN